MKYPKLIGICKTAIEIGLCKGCNLLELENFVGKSKCELVPSGLNLCKKILKGEQIKI